MTKLRVGVLMGGKSIESEVSFNSGRTVCDHLDTVRYDVIPIFQTRSGTLYLLPWHFLHRGKITDFEHRLATEAQKICWDNLKTLIDFMYIAVHGRYAEDGTLQGMLEVLGIPYLGSDIFGSAVGMNKVIQKQLLKIHGIDVPNGIVCYPEQIKDNNLEKLKKEIEQQNITLPLVVKPHKEGSSLGVTIVHTWKDLLQAIKYACHIHPGEQQAVLIEEKLVGMEFSCITITDYKTGKWLPLIPTEVVPDSDINFFDYEQKYMPGRCREFTPPRCDVTITKKIQNTCVIANKALGFSNISRIDGFVTKDNRIVIVDPNSLSGMGPASFLFREAAELNMSHTDLINYLIETDLHTYGMLNTIIKQEEKETAKMKIKKIRVAVLMGGNTNEREVALESGRNIFYKLSPQKYEALPIFVDNNMELFHINQKLLVRNSTQEIQSLLEPGMKINWSDLPNIADFVFIGLHGGLGENGGVQGALEMLNMPYNGSSVFASSLCMDKYKTNQFLKSYGFETPQALLLAKDEWLADRNAAIATIMKQFALPIIIKPNDDGCSVMVQKAKNEKDIAPALESIFSKSKSFALIEECITGMELTVGVIGNETPQALPPSQAISSADILSIEEKFLPGAGKIKHQHHYQQKHYT